MIAAIEHYSVLGMTPLDTSWLYHEPVHMLMEGM